ncbi:ECF transporter S component [Petrocella atlantisensis]|uniref:ECF transporter S component n=1 Tax=Petrocella atlantisensis TaxID=2173034 RepID=A0A3P7PTJ8_9FIRM|nr:ECF transporter S component [Petrocella atlantisensis]VDN46561.1 ECF transporter S component [Petrocella atlantisensis]
MKIRTKDLVTTGLMIAMAAVLAQFPIYGSIAFDALPAFLTAVMIGPALGGIVGSIAHLLVAMFTGFPLTLPLHLLIAVMMFVSCFIYGKVRQDYNRYLAIALGIIINGPVSLGFISIFAKVLGMPFSGMVMFTTLLLPLLIGATINIVVADMVYGIIKEKIQIKA